MALHSLFSPTLSICHRPHQLTCSLFPKRRAQFLFLARSLDSGAGNASSSAAAAVEDKQEASAASQVVVEEKVVEEEKKGAVSSNGAVAAKNTEVSPAFTDTRWIGGTWDLRQFEKDGKIDWDAVIDAEVKRRKWLEDNPEASSNDEPVTFDTSVIPWWSWVKRFHLPEAELLNGRAAMIGFFMAYFVDSLTGAGLVDQMGNFFCKTLLLIAAVGVLFIRKNEDIETLKKLVEETTFYDKQWQATWQDDNVRSDSSKQ